MKYLLLIAVFAGLVSCSKDPVPVSPTFFKNDNVTLRDYNYSSTPSGAYISIVFDAPAITGISKVELFSSASTSALSYKSSPTAGSMDFRDYSRPGITPTNPTIYYHLKFTRTDNTTFQTGTFTVPK